MGNFEEEMQEQTEEIKIINEILEITRENLEGLTKDELQEVRKTMINKNGYCECGNNLQDEADEILGFCKGCR